ncbi:hypothetical protein K3G39_20320 [Pontibacter sp. HSC-14F20]|uniref:hypothetical protein n=1 Tax=Pontibacter sp. HSC-14F20 TaxID=2864136 RepID=UPI001C7376A0|nr:hypothetical protein [Pontibacter sp. HSC-14F20]MBX0335584.1 hypothetical protein [Pontibacter sp. HSC-14F20]
MGVQRTIRVRVLTKDKRLSDFIKNLTNNFWSLQNPSGAYTSIPLDDEGEFDYITFKESESVFKILDLRDAYEKPNAVNLWNQELEESINLLIHPLEGDYDGYSKQYELNFSLGIGQRISGADRYTDYGYYLNQLIPKLQLINCQVCEFECHDYDC